MDDTIDGRMEGPQSTLAAEVEVQEVFTQTWSFWFGLRNWSHRRVTKVCQGQAVCVGSGREVPVSK